MKVLVSGQGAVAEATVTALLEAGHEVRLLSPGAEILAGRWPRGVEAWRADLGARRSLQGAADGCEVTIQLAAVPDPGLPAVDVAGTRRLAAEAQRARCARLVLLSSARASRSVSADSRAWSEVEDVVRGFRGVWSILRATTVYAPGEGALAALAVMVRTLPAIPLPDSGRVRLQPLWHEDLGRALVRAATAPQAVGQPLHVAGPEVATLGEVIDRLCALVGRAPARIPVPALAATVGAEAAALLGLRLPARALALAELDGDSALPPTIENALTSVLGIEPTLLEDGLRRLLAEVPMRTPGEGAIERRRFWADARGASLRARELRDAFRREARAVLRLEGPADGKPFKKGTLLTAHAPLRGLVGLRIADVTPHAVTAVTVEGDGEAAIVTFRFLDLDHTVRVEIQVDGAASPLTSRLREMAAGLLDDFDWTGAVERLVALSGGRATGGVQREARALDERESEQVRRRAEELRRVRERARAPSPRARAAGARPGRPGRPRTSARPRSPGRGPAPA